jgi:hypothetical protein
MTPAMMNRELHPFARAGQFIINQLPMLGIIACVYLVFALILAFSGFSYSALSIFVSLLPFMFFLVLPVVIVGYVLRCIGHKAVKRTLLGSRCQICVYCLYDLSARPRSEETCSECGKLASRRECVRLWCKLLRTQF